MQRFKKPAFTLRATLATAVAATVAVSAAFVWTNPTLHQAGLGLVWVMLATGIALLAAMVPLWALTERARRQAVQANEALRAMAHASPRRDNEPWYHLLFDANPQPMWVLDIQTLRFLKVNDAAVKCYGYSRHEFLAMNIEDIRATSELTLLREALDMADGLSGPQPLGVWAHRRKDGQTIHVDLVANNIDLDGRRARLTLVRDISNQLAAERRLSDVPRQLMLLEQETGRRLARRVHDDIGQALALAQLQLGVCLGALRGSSSSLESGLHQSVAHIEEAATRAREILLDLRPAPLEEQGLVEALRLRAESMRSLPSVQQLRVGCAHGLDQVRWPPGIERVAYDVAREATTNAVRHAQASVVEVSVEGSPSQLRLAVSDNGIGIPLQFVRGRPDRLGITGMRELAATIGARLQVAPQQPRGTLVTLQWPQHPDGNDLHH